MNQAEGDRPVTLNNAKKKVITRRQAAEEMKLSERHIRRLIWVRRLHGEIASA